MSRLGELSKLIGSINDRVDELCASKCKELGIDAGKAFKDVVRKRENVGEAVDGGLPQTTVDAVKDDNDGKFDADELINDPEKAKSVATAISGNGEDARRQKPPQSDDGEQSGYTVSDLSVDPSLEAKVGSTGDDKKKKKNGGGSLLGGLFLKRAGKGGYKLLAKRGLKKAASKAAAKTVGKQAAKTLGKSAAKKLPFGLGLIPAAGFAAHRLSKGDIAGAAGELASGGVAAIPVLGTAGSLGIDAYLAKRDIDGGLGESFRSSTSLYERAKKVFESESGVEEGVDGWCFDDYVAESKIDNAATGRRVDESSAFYGHSAMVESFGTNQEELNRLFRQLSPDGKVSMDDLVPKDGDSPSDKMTKRRIKEILDDEHDGGFMNQKQSKKAIDSMRDSSGQLTKRQLWHKGLDDTGAAINNSLSNYFIPQEVSRRLNIPRNLGKLAGAGVGGLLFGPVGAAAGYGLASLLANRHDRYKKEQIDALHGGKADDSLSGYGKGVATDAGKAFTKGAGGLVGAGIGTLLGGPVGGVIGAGLGHLGQKALGAVLGRKD